MVIKIQPFYKAPTMIMMMTMMTGHDSTLPLTVHEEEEEEEAYRVSRSVKSHRHSRSWWCLCFYPRLCTSRGRVLELRSTLTIPLLLVNFRDHGQTDFAQLLDS